MPLFGPDVLVDLPQQPARETIPATVKELRLEIAPGQVATVLLSRHSDVLTGVAVRSKLEFVSGMTVVDKVVQLLMIPGSQGRVWFEFRRTNIRAEQTGPGSTRFSQSDQGIDQQATVPWAGEFESHIVRFCFEDGSQVVTPTRRFAIALPDDHEVTGIGRR
jgi:hypothetical protein